MSNNIFRSRSLDAETKGPARDQYADGKAARVWELYIGEKKDRTNHYRDFLTSFLKEHKCHLILDVACGTGIDSVLLLEEGFEVVSVDICDKMLKYALKERWNRRNEPGFQNWVIEEANWLTLSDDIQKPGTGFDAIICLGNSFGNLLDHQGDMRDIKLAIWNFHYMLAPGGYLLIDHRNYDYVLKYGKTPAQNIYYNSKHVTDIPTSVLYVGQNPVMVTCEYTMDISDAVESLDHTDSEYTKKGRYHGDSVEHFKISSYPHRLEPFTKILKEIFGQDTMHSMYGDFQPLNQIKDPAYYIHIIQKRTV